MEKWQKKWWPEMTSVTGSNLLFQVPEYVNEPMGLNTKATGRIIVVMDME